MSQNSLTVGYTQNDSMHPSISAGAFQYGGAAVQFWAPREWPYSSPYLEAQIPFRGSSFISCIHNSLGHYPHPAATSEVRKIDQAVNGQLCLHARLSLHQNSITSASLQQSVSPPHHSSPHEQDPDTLELFHLRQQPAAGNPPVSGWEPLPQI